jgi:outer membrane protein insertion porin family
LQIGAGYSSAENISLMAAIRQENVFGSGNYLGLEVNTSKSNRQLVLSTVDPYFTADGISRAFDLYSRTNRPLSGEATDYTLKTQGGSVRFGVPFTESDTVYFGVGAESWVISPGSNPGLVDFTQQYGSKAQSFPITLGWQRDERDSALVPTKGWYQRAYADWGAAGDVKYLRAVYQLQTYIPINRQFTVGLNGELGWGTGLGGQPFPVLKNFYSGGLGSVRGFEQGSLGPRYANGAARGGAKKITLNGEVIAPFPGAGNDRTLRLFGFVDAGMVYGENSPVRLQDMRLSTGMGMSWISPVGPLRLALAKPLRREASDRIQSFQFQIGTAF